MSLKNDTNRAVPNAEVLVAASSEHEAKERYMMCVVIAESLIL